LKNFINTIKNIFKIEELKSRILYTLGFIFIYRMGSYVVLPGVDPNQLEALQRQTSSGLLGLLNVFTGGAFSNASVFALGIMPYISASIVIQLLGVAIPYFQKLQKEGESGRKKINQMTRYLTVIICLAQGFAFAQNLMAQLPPSGILMSTFWFPVLSMVILATGTVFCMWLGEKITDKGLGNGISLLIMVGIISRLPSAFFGEFSTALSIKGGGLVMFLTEIFIWLAVVVFTIAIIQATRRIPVQFAKRIVGNKQYGGVRQYIPLKINAAGVMPIIFAQAIMFIPITLAGFSDQLTGFVATMSDFNGFWYNFIFATLIVLFTYFYTAIAVNPSQMADEMKKNGGFIPGVKPGKKTAEFIDGTISRITLPGAISLAIIAILPVFAHLAGINTQFSQFYGGTSLLIMVGVVLDTLQQIETHLLMRHYDGLMKGGRIKGRSSTPAAVAG
jgi:preprotein translocase subunit SecY